MKFGIKTIDDIKVEGKTVLLRVDINQPIDREHNTLKDTTRISACIPTIRELSDRGGKIVLLAHQGSDIEYKNYYTTKPHSHVLSELLGKEVRFIDDVCGPAARTAMKELNNGEILLLDNVRFLAEEQTLFELNLKLTHEQQAKTLLVSKLSPLADIYVCDAFAAAHRDQPSLCGFQQVLPSVMGRLFEKEFSVLSELMECPACPCVFVLGGAKIADAFLMMNTVLKKNVADMVLTGGLVANIMLWANGVDIGECSKDFVRNQGYENYVKIAKELITEFDNKIVIPLDCAYIKDGRRYECTIGKIPSGELLVDIGSKTARKYKQGILNAKTVFANGPMGIFEEPESELGTKTVWEALGETEGYSVIGGGDSITASNKYGVTGKINYICTGGGALIRFLSGEDLPVVRALLHGSFL